MFADFEKAFFEKNEIEEIIPQEILQVLSEDLPKDFEYINMGTGVAALSKDKIDNIQISGRVQFKENLFDISNKESLTTAEWLELAYRTQQSLEIIVEEEGIIIDGENINTNQFFVTPFEENNVSSTVTLRPASFKAPYKVMGEGNGVIRSFNIQRQPHNSMTESKFKSIDKESFSISYIIDEQKKSLQFNFNLNMEDAKSVEEGIESLKLYESCITGDFKLNSYLFNQENFLNNKNEHESIEFLISFWEKVLCLEKKIKVAFVPKSKITEEEIITVEQLYMTLIKNEPFKEYIILKEITVNEFEGQDIDETLTSEGLAFQFKEKREINIFNQDIELDSIKGFFDFKVAAIKKSTEGIKAATLVVEPIEGKKIYQSTLYIDKQNEGTEHKSLLTLQSLQDAKCININ